MYFVLVCKVTNSDLDSHKSVSIIFSYNACNNVIIIYVYSQNTVVIFLKTFFFYFNTAGPVKFKGKKLNIMVPSTSANVMINEVIIIINLFQASKI